MLCFQVHPGKQKSCCVVATGQQVLGWPLLILVLLTREHGWRNRVASVDSLWIANVSCSLSARSFFTACHIPYALFCEEVFAVAGAESGVRAASSREAAEAPKL